MNTQNTLLLMGIFIVILILLVVPLSIVLLFKTPEHKVTRSDNEIEGGGYTINLPIIQPTNVSSIHPEDIKRFVEYFQAVYPLLGDLVPEEPSRETVEMVSTLLAGVSFWYYKVGDTDMMKLIQEYLGKYYSWNDMQNSGYEPPQLNQLFSAPFTPPNLQRNVYDPYGWWNVPFYNGYPDNTYLEGIHGTDSGSGYDVYGYWTYIFPGTGVYMNIGKSLRSHNKLHANYLLHYHQDESRGLYNFLNLIIESASIGEGWKKDKQGYYTGELDENMIQGSSSTDPPPAWTEPKYQFQVNNSITMYLDQRACNNFGGPIPAGKQTVTQSTYSGYATKHQIQFANNLINNTLDENHVKDTLKRLGVEYPIPMNNTVVGDDGVKAAVVYYILCAICTPDPGKNINTGFYLYKDLGSIYWNKDTSPSDRQFWYWINTASNTANFDRFMTITAKKLGYDSIQFTAEPNGSGWLAFEFVYVGDDIKWDDKNYPVKKVEKNWNGWDGVNNLSKIFNPFNPSENAPCNFKQPQAMKDGKCDNPWGEDRPLCSYICEEQAQRGIHSVIQQ